jgi:hypothetical protein
MRDPAKIEELLAICNSILIARHDGKNHNELLRQTARLEDFLHVTEWDAEFRRVLPFL